MKLQRNNIETIIFDMDGVITSEFLYWDAAALTVYELLYSHEFYGDREIDREWCRENVREVFNTVFCHGKTVQAVKRLGVNTNWDLAYLVFSVSKYLETEIPDFDSWHFDSVCMFIENIAVQPPKLYENMEGLLSSAIPGEDGCYKRGTGLLWEQLLQSFQRWFHGDGMIEGLKTDEEPIVSLGEIQKTLAGLKNAGFRLGIGTGRPREEILFPLQMWNLTGYFKPECIVTYDEVLEAEKALGMKNKLAKPHPFVFQKAAFGASFRDEEIVKSAMSKDLAARCLVVGDAPSDFLAARMGGFPFCAVLTGVAGQAARGYFEENKAEMVLDSILDLKVEV